jgi:UDP-N-acetylmuramate--alanine ligase
LDLEYLLITNIELDHTDYYKDMDDYRLAFKQMNQKTKKLTLVLENKNNTVQSDFSGFEKIKEIPITHHNLDNIW